MIRKISDTELWNDISKSSIGIGGGIYKIFSQDNHIRKPIERLLDKDINGILYIGSATSYLNRVINLKKSILPDYNGQSHICGRRYKSNPSIALKFPAENLYIELIPTDNPIELEKTELKKYFDKFGELPPLNRKI
jgi:hypothetical protein